MNRFIIVRSGSFWTPILSFLMLCGLLGMLVLPSCQQPSPPPPETSDEVGPEGGVFRADNGLLLRIPPSALSQTFRFESTEAKVDAPPQGYILVSPSVEIKPQIDFPEGLPAQAVLPILKDKIPADKSLWDIFVFQRVDNKWVRIQRAIDEATPAVTFNINKTGIYAAFVGAPVPTEKNKFEDLREYSQPAERITEKPSEKTAEQPSEKPAEKLSEQSPEKPAEPIADAGSEPVADKGSEPAMPDAAPEKKADTSTSDSSPTETGKKD